MHILLADTLSDDGVDALRSDGHTVDLLNDRALVDAVPGVDVLVVRSTRVESEVINAATRLGLIVRAGAGVDTIDVERAAARGVFVCNVPGRNSIAVAELTLALLLAVDRSIADGAADLRSGHWDKARYKSARGLAGRTLGIIGLGAIGLEVAKRAAAFDMHVIGIRKPDNSPAREKAVRSLGIRLVDGLDDLLAASDVVSVHVPGGDATRGMIDRSFLAKMRPDAVLLNTSRGSTMVEQDLLDALDRTDLMAGLDVFPDEPSTGSGPFESVLASHPSVVGSHHIGASTTQAAEAVIDGVRETIAAYMQGELLNCVNLDRVPPRRATLTVRHVDEVGVLASVLEVLRSHDLNVQEMRNRIFEGAHAAVASVSISQEPPDGAIRAIEALPAVFGVQVLGE